MTEQETPRQRRARAKQDPIEWHGHHIVTETDLGAVFEDDGANRQRIKRRRIFHGIVLFLLVGLIGAAAFVAVGVARGEIRLEFLETAAEADPSASADECPAGPFDYQDPSSITVDVYNSTTIDGLAGTAAGQLRERAFAVRTIGNRDASSVNMVAVITSGEAGRANAFTVQRNIPGATYRSDEREDRSVDVVLGLAYDGIIPEEGLDITPAGLTCTVEEDPAATPEPAAG